MGEELRVVVEPVQTEAVPVIADELGVLLHHVIEIAGVCQDPAGVTRGQVYAQHIAAVAAGSTG